MKENKTKKYYSKPMEERRNNVLRTARKLIGDHGIDGFTMKQLAHAAGVSGATLFNIYTNRENLINEAVLDAFNTSMGEGVSSTPETLKELTRYVDWTHEEIIKLGSYIPIIVNSYFSSARENRIREILLREASAPYIYYLEKYKDRDILRSSDSVAEFGELISNQIFSSMKDWSSGRVTNDQLERKLKISVFTIMIPVIRKSHREEMSHELRTLI